MSDWNAAIDSAIEEVRRAVRACHELDRTGLALDAMDALEENIRSLKRPAPLDGGWVLVPREPTQEMIAAYWDAVEKFDMKLDLPGRLFARTRSVWEAMLAAAPASTEKAEGER